MTTSRQQTGALLTPQMIQTQWSWLSDEVVADIDGRVDRLYRALIRSGLTRGEAAKEIHQAVMATRCPVAVSA